MHKLKKIIFSSIAVISLSATVSPIMSVFAEGENEARPQTELTAGKEGDKDKSVGKNDQALTDNGKNEKQSDKETTVLNKEEKKAEPKKEELKKEEPKKEEPKKEEKLPDAGFETVGLSLVGASAAGYGITQLAKHKAKKTIK
jgi:CGMP-gated channel